MNFIKTNLKWVVILGVIVLLVLWGISSYNSFVTMGEKIDGQWAQVESQYQRRFDLIPNLVSSIEGAMTQEKDVFLKLAEARSKYSGAVTTEEKVAATRQVETSLGRLLAVVESYPTLTSIQRVSEIMVSLEGTENRIAVERMNYNNLVRDFNASVKRFPTMILAGIFGVDARSYFEITEGAEVAPEVNFN